MYISKYFIIKQGNIFFRKWNYATRYRCYLRMAS